MTNKLVLWVLLEPVSVLTENSCIDWVWVWVWVWGISDFFNWVWGFVWVWRIPDFFN